MSTSIENRIVKMEMDHARFTRAAQEVLDALNRIDRALEFQNAEKAATQLNGVFGTLQASLRNATTAANETGRSMLEVCGALEQTSASLSFVTENAGVAGLSLEGLSSIAQGAAANISDAMANAAMAVSADVSSIADAAEGSAKRTAAAVTAVSGMPAAAKAAMLAGTAVAGAALIALVTHTGEQAVTAVKEALANAKAKIEDGLKSLKESFTRFAENFKEIWSSNGFIKTLRDGISEVIDKTKEKLKELFPVTTAELQKIKAGFVSDFVQLQQAATYTFDQIRARIRESLEKIHATVATAMEAVKNAFTAPLNAIKDFGDRIRSHFGKGKTAAEELGAALEKLSDDIEKPTAAAEELRQKLDALGSTHAPDDTAEIFRRLTSAMGDAKESAAELADAEQNVTDASVNAADGAQQMADAEQNVTDASVNAADGAQQMADAEQNTADASGNAADSAQQASDAFETFGDAAGDSGNETEQFAESIDEAKRKFDILDDAVNESTDDFDIFGDACEGVGKALKNFLSGSLGRFGSLSGAAKALGSDFHNIGEKIKNNTTLTESFAAGFDLLKAAAPLALTALIGKFKENTEETEKSVSVLDILTGNVRGLGETARSALSGIKDRIVEPIANVFSLSAAFAVTERAVNRVIDSVENLVKSLSLDQIKAGLGEYELKVNSVQTIMQSTGASLGEVTDKLNELNEYADKTVYVFSDMTSNIGKFTNQGVSLNDAVLAMKGISNEAALAGASSQQASNAMYNFAQSLSTGYVQLVDWKSIENAMMATKGFKEELIATAEDLGTLVKQEDKWVSTTTNAQGKISNAFDAAQGFRDSLSSQWLNNDVLLKTLAKYADETTELGKAAYHAAQDIKTGSQLMDTLKEAVGSGWAQTFEIIIGDFEEAKAFWSGINSVISPALDAISDARNGLLEGWDETGGRSRLIESLLHSLNGIVDAAKAAKEGLSRVLQPVTGWDLTQATDKIAAFMDKLTPNEGHLEKIRDIFETLGRSFRTVKSAASELAETVKDRLGLPELADPLGSVLDIAGQAAEKVRAFANWLKEDSAGIRETLGTVAESLRSFFDSAVSVAKQLSSAIGEAWKSALPTILNVVTGVVNVLSTLITKIGAFIEKHGSAVGAVAVGLSIFTKARLAISTVSTLFGPLSAGIGKVVKGVTLAVKAIKLLKALKVGGAVSAVSGVLKTLSSQVPGLSSALGGLENSLKGMAKQMAASALKTVALTAAIALVAVAVAGAVIAYKNWQDKLKEQAEAEYGLTEAQEKRIERIEDLNRSSESTLAQQAKTISGIQDEYEEYETLWKELQQIVDENGKVKEGYEDRADVIVNKLNGGLETELELTGGQITNYQELQGEIDGVIQKKKELAILEANSAAREEAKANVGQAAVDYYSTKSEREAAEAELDALQSHFDELENSIQNKAAAGGMYGVLAYAEKLYSKDYNQTKADIEALTKTLAELSEEENDALETYSRYRTILKNAGDYEDAINGAGNLEEALTRLSYGLMTHTTATKEQLEQQVTDLEETLRGMYSAVASGAEEVTADDIAGVLNALAIAQQEVRASEISREIDALKAEIAEKGIDLNKTIFGNIDTNERQVLEWTGENLDKYRDAIKSWGAEVDDLKGSISTVFGSSKEFDGVEIAFSPMLQTSDGAVLLDADTVNKYIFSLIEKAGEGWTNEKLFKLDAEGLEIDGQRIQGLIADIGETARETGEAMHYVGENGALEMLYKELEKSTAANDAGAKITESAAEGVTDNAGKMKDAGGKLADSTAEGVRKEKIAVKKAGGDIPAAAAEGANDKQSVMKDAGTELSDSTAEGISDNKSAADNAGAELTEAAAEGAGSNANEMSGAGKDTGKQYVAGLVSGLGDPSWTSKLVSTIKRIATTIKTLMNASLGVNSPSRVARETGQFYGEGLVLGLKDRVKDVEKQSATLSEAVASSAVTVRNILSGDFREALTISPVTDLTYRSSALPITGSVTTGGYFRMPENANDRSTADPSLRELKGLREEMRQYNEQLAHMEVRMYGDAVVGQLSPRINENLGTEATLRRRGI